METQSAKDKVMEYIKSASGQTVDYMELKDDLQYEGFTVSEINKSLRELINSDTIAYCPVTNSFDVVLG
jgi:uncharacterized protein Smg (DUF494 family)